MRHTISILILTAAVTATASPAGAFSFIDRLYGTPETGLAARSRALGGAGTALGNGAYSLVDNPAALLLKRGTRLQGLGAISRASENRFVPLFDTFDSFVDETAIAVNDNTYANITGGLVLDQWDNGLVVSAGVFNRYDSRYDYRDELRTTETSDDIINNLVISSEGILRTATVGVAYGFENEEGKFGGVGAAVNYYFGTFTDRQALVGVEDPSESFSQTLERDLDGFSITVGAVGRLSERIDIGLSLESSAKLSDDFTYREDDAIDPDSTGSGDLNLPFRLQVGTVYRPRNSLKTTFAMDLIYQPWSQTDDGINDNADRLNDVWEVRFGLEHVFYNNLPGRLGFRYGESYGLDEADNATFTFGFGYLLDRLAIDISAEVTKRNTRQDPLRSRPDQGPAVGYGLDRVEDTLVRGFVGLDYSF